MSFFTHFALLSPVASPGFLHSRMVVAVTGASGHIGANLIRRLLEQGRQVRALVHRDRRALEGLPVDTIEGSILDLKVVDKLIQNAQVVYHLAAQVSIDGDMGGLVQQTNTEGTRNIVNACLAHEVHKLIHFSSIHALEGRVSNHTSIITEETNLALDPENLTYGRTKAEAEAVILEGAAAGLNASIVNPGGVLGPYDFKPSRMGEVLLQLHGRAMPALVDGGFAWVDVRDVVDAAIACETKGRPGERYILAGEWASFRVLANTVQEVTGVSAPRITAPVWLAKLGVPLVSRFSKLMGKEPLYTMESICAIQCHRHLSYEKALTELNFNPRPLTETVRDTFAWHKSQGSLP